MKSREIIQKNEERLQPNAFYSLRIISAQGEYVAKAFLTDITKHNDEKYFHFLHRSIYEQDKRRLSFLVSSSIKLKDTFFDEQENLIIHKNSKFPVTYNLQLKTHQGVRP